MIRPLILSLAFAASPVLASDHYRAEPVAPAAQERFVARENIWRCTASVCVSRRTATRPAIVCSTLVRKVGALRSFAVEGRAYSTDELASCNRRAR